VIVEAIDTAYTIGAAILAWIAVLAAAATVVLFTGVLVGAWAWRAARKRLTGPSWAYGRLRARILARRRLRRPQGPSGDPDYQEAA
jgi:hypothetical protein